MQKNYVMKQMICICIKIWNIFIKLLRGNILEIIIFSLGKYRCFFFFFVYEDDVYFMVVNIYREFIVSQVEGSVALEVFDKTERSEGYFVFIKDQV